MSGTFIIQPQTNEWCFPWYCPQCEISGVVTIELPMEREVIERNCHRLHAKRSPQCTGSIALAPAENWYVAIPRRHPSMPVSEAERVLKGWPPIAPDAEEKNRNAREQIADILGGDRFEDMTGKEWWERTLCPNEGERLVRMSGGGKYCPKCEFHLDDTDR